MGAPRNPERLMSIDTIEIGAIPAAWTRRHLLDLESLSAEEINVVLDTAVMLKEATGGCLQKLPLLTGRTIANLFFEAAQSYQNNPTALHLRAMNILYEGLKEKGALMLVPRTAVESMGLGGLMGAAALRQQTLSEGDAKAGPPAI